ncbi:MAG: glycerophosphodiester phosphodiesterase family protein [Nitrospiria bacterium]
MTSYTHSVPTLVAHRGWAARYPENTLLAFKEAVAAGAYFIEFDIQMCKDGTPVILHDPFLVRTSGVNKNVFDCTYESIKDIRTCENRRFGKRFLHDDTNIPTLSRVVEWMAGQTAVKAFLDIKVESLKKYGAETVIKTVMDAIGPISKRCCVISKDTAALGYARRLGVHRIGWVLQSWTEAARRKALELAPEYLFVNHKKTPSSSCLFWPGSWRWTIYEVDRPEMAMQLHRRGADLIETMDIGTMLKHPNLHPGESCDSHTL